ncbi:MAG: hypothetical protein IPK72_13570 [Candidatus Eisenbacteria bacterium]|nr:hypothetical protein [Candidatus Eisenbacteria bacterium]
MLRRGLLRVWMGLSTISLSATLLGGTAVGSSRAECISADEYMQVVAQLDLNGNNLDIALMGTRLYLANEELGLAVVDVSDPYAPTLLSSLDTGTPITQVEAVNGLVYVADGVGLRIVKVNAAGAASVLGTFGASGTRRDLTVASGLAYFATAEFGVRVIDVGFPALPVERANIPLASPGKVRVRGQFAYIDYEVAQGEPSRLEVVDMSVPTSPLSVATLPDFCLGGASDFALSGDYLYAFDESDTLPIVDISTPSSPVKLAGTAYADYIPPEAIVIEGDVAYLTTYEVATIATWDLSNPTAPTLLGRLEEDNNLYSPFRLAVRAPFAYLMAGPLVQVIDVSSPLTPSIEGLLDTPGTATGVASVGSLNYVADGSDGLRIIDSTVPDAPVEVGALDTPGTASHVALAGDRAYVADGTGGVAVVDVSLPGLPLSLGTVPTSGFARRVRTSGGLLYVAASAAGLLVVDPQDPQSPIELGALPPVGATNDVAISASLAVTVEELRGHRTPGSRRHLQSSLSSRDRLAPVVPPPARSRAGRREGVCRPGRDWRGSRWPGDRRPLHPDPAEPPRRVEPVRRIDRRRRTGRVGLHDRPERGRGGGRDPVRPESGRSRAANARSAPLPAGPGPRTRGRGGSRPFGRRGRRAPPDLGPVRRDCGGPAPLEPDRNPPVPESGACRRPDPLEPPVLPGGNDALRRARARGHSPPSLGRWDGGVGRPERFGSASAGRNLLFTVGKPRSGPNAPDHSPPLRFARLFSWPRPPDILARNRTQ